MGQSESVQYETPKSLVSNQYHYAYFGTKKLNCIFNQESKETIKHKSNFKIQKEISSELKRQFIQINTSKSKYLQDYQHQDNQDSNSNEIEINYCGAANNNNNNPQKYLQQVYAVQYPINENEVFNEYRNLDFYKQQIQQLEEMIESNKQFQEKDIQQQNLFIGKGAQGSVQINFLKFNRDENTYFDRDYLRVPIATKIFKDEEQFVRESSILTKLDTNIRPMILCIYNLRINMELCICNLNQFRSFIHQNYLFQDQLFLSLLLEMVAKLQPILNKGFFHGDIKPENVAIAIRKGHASIIYIDFGGSSWDREDYLNYYTPAFCNEDIYQMVYDEEKILTKDQIRFAEMFSICRTLQYIMLPQQLVYFFSRQKTVDFLLSFESQYPLTIKFLKPILLNTLNSTMEDSYMNNYLKELQNIAQDFSFDESLLYNSQNVFQQI